MSQTALVKFMRKDIMDGTKITQQKHSMISFCRKLLLICWAQKKTCHHRTEDCQILELLQWKSNQTYICTHAFSYPITLSYCHWEITKMYITWFFCSHWAISCRTTFACTMWNLFTKIAWVDKSSNLCTLPSI
jgi:hypothetical protein